MKVKNVKMKFMQKEKKRNELRGEEKKKLKIE